MDNKVKKLLFDIEYSINAIEKYVSGMDFNDYLHLENESLKDAVERRFLIIGEAAHRLDKDFPEVQISNQRAIIGMRHRIVPGYDVVADELVWDTIHHNLPKLKQEVQKLLKG